MGDSGVFLSSKQAASLLRVHESSVKRWCNAGDLPCAVTSGGHRKIQVEHLMAFAQARDVSCMLTPFASDAPAVWDGLMMLENQASHAKVIEITQEWLEQSETNRIIALMTLIIEEGHPLASVMDGVLSPIMRHFGSRYVNGELSIGDEHCVTQSMREVLIGLSLNSRQTGLKPASKTAVVGCARGEVHELGALMVRLILENAGWKTVYLGLNVPTEEFSDQQLKHRADMVCVSITPVSGWGDVQNIVTLMDRMYESSAPYRLAIGGGIMAHYAEMNQDELAFVDLSFFDAIVPFSSWLTGQA
ncbi:cobalamin B12-binding domain-containing protein [bacterium]|nr:cobalamin B12-binding domain-containing protein [bacterium]